MATVPRVTGPSVSLQGAPNVRQTNPTNADLLGIGARQQQQLGGAITDLGGQMLRIEHEALQRANALRVDDALNQVSEQAIRLQHDPKDGFMAAKGYDALQRQSGMALEDEYTGKLDKVIDTVSATLGNDSQRQQFAMRVNGLRTNFLGQAMNYRGQQQKDYGISVDEASVKGAVNAGVLNFSDPTNVAMQTTRIRAAYLGGTDPQTGVYIPGLAAKTGKAAAWGEEQAATAISSMHLGAIRSAMEAGNINAAMNYREKYGSQMTANDLLTIGGTLQRDYDTRRGAVAADQAFASAQPSIAPNDFDRFVSITQAMESNGQRFGKDGKLLQGPVTRSGERAMGEMQVMPATAKNPGYGIKPANMDDPEDIARVGREKAQVLIKMFGGDVGKAWAAYNWGEGNVRAAERSAQDNPGKSWLDFAPAETQAYVKRGLSQWSSGSAPGPKMTREELVQSAERSLGPNASPVAVQAARARALQRFEDHDKAEQQRGNEAVVLAQQQLLQNPDFTALPPSTRDALARYVPGKVDELISYAAKLKAGQPIETNQALYLKLTEPATLRGLSDSAFYALRSQLSKEDFQRFAEKRATLVSGTGTNQPGDLNDGAIGRVLENRLDQIGIVKPKENDTAGQERYGAIRRFVDSSLIDAQKAAGKKFNDAETSAYIDGLFAKSVTLRSTFLGIPTGANEGRRLLQMKVGDIPGDQRDAIKTAFKKRGVSNPTDGEILGAYFAGQSQQPTNPRTP